MANTLNDPWGAQILCNNYTQSYAEWRLTVRERDDFKQIVLDRAFLDHAGQFWIVDYKIVHDPTELETATEKYINQLTNYMRAVRHLKPGIVIKSGLYFPLQAFWRELPLVMSNT